MAKITLPTITNAQNISLINDNFDKIETALNEDVLYRDNPIGEPNQLNNDLDANGNDVFNVQMLDTAVLKINGQFVQPSEVATSESLKIANNLNDVADVAASRANLGLGNVNNTSDANKPISIAQQAALDLKLNITDAATIYAPIASPTFTGSATAPDYSIVGAPATARRLHFKTNTLDRWQVVAEGTAEGGANAGSNFIISRFNDAGAFIDSPFSILRSTGVTTLFQAVIGAGSSFAGSVAATTITASSTITPSQTAGIVGTTAANNANAGSVGEFISNSATGVALTSGITANITSISLTAGDWDVHGVVQFAPAGTTTVGGILSGLSSTSATIGAVGTFQQGTATYTAGGAQAMTTPTARFTLASTTTIFLVANTFFSVSTMAANGFLRARRVR